MRSRAIFTFAGAVMILLSAVPLTHSQSGTIAGSFKVTDTNNNGLSEYLVRFQYPARVDVGSNFTVQVVVEVQNLTGLKLYVTSYGVSAILTDLAGNLLATGSVQPVTGVRIYPGGHWGPLNVTLFVQSSPSGAQSGGTENGSLTISIFTMVWYDEPLTNNYPDSGSREAGTVFVQTEAPNGYNLQLPVIILLAIAGVLLAVVLVPTIRGRRKKPI
jgi:hypothetical protein